VFHAQRLRRAALGKCPTHLIKAGEKIHFRGQDYIYKTLLGQILVAACEDNQLAIAPDAWVVDDWRLVSRDRGTFVIDTGPNGEHGDSFSAAAHALWGLEGTGGNVEASAAGIWPQPGLGTAGDEDPEHEALFGAPRELFS
jgi:hypothetical protein